MAAQERECSLAAIGIKWRMRERQVSQSWQEIKMQKMSAKDLHPLVFQAPISIEEQQLTNSRLHSTLDESFSQSRSTCETSPELEILKHGDLDPLGVLGSCDDLTKTAEYESTRSRKTTTLSKQSVRSHTVKHKWKTHTDRLLAKYADTTFKIKASMLEVNDLENDISFASKSEYQKAEKFPKTTVITKTRARIEELETNFIKVDSRPHCLDKKTIEISQKQYISKVKEMETRLIESWNNNQKVEALRIAIKCVKLLADTDTAPQLYPCVFALVSEILDVFGNLVFNRIRSRASEDENGQPLPEPLSDHFMSSDINIQATEMCRNWFYKTACIRELLPRIYIELALLRCYRFLCDGEYFQITSRLSNMIKGVGDPMVALYTRLYLAFTSCELLEKTFLIDQTIVVSSTLCDYFCTFHWYRESKLEQWLLTHDMLEDEYLALHSPAVEWLVKCAAPGATQDTFDTLMTHYQEYSNCSMVLKHLTECFGAKFYASRPSEILGLIRLASRSQISEWHLYSLVAVQLSHVAVIAGDEAGGKWRFLNDAWSYVTSQDNVTQYMECAAAYMKLLAAHFSHREALILLKDIVKHLNSATLDTLTAKTYNMLGAVIENVVFGAQAHFEFFSKVIPSPAFLWGHIKLKTLIGMFKQESSVDVAKKVLRAFVSSNLKNSSVRSRSLRLHVVGSEAAVAHTLLVVCRRVHDSLDSLSSLSERDEATRDISAFITRLGDTLKSKTATERAQDEEADALLMLYTDCRRAFYKLEPIIVLLCTKILQLAMYVHKRINNGTASGIGMTKRASLQRGFLQSCLAFAHVTIPSIDSPLTKLQLLILAASGALVMNCIPQMDALVKASIVLIAELNYKALQPENQPEEELNTSTFRHRVAGGLLGAGSNSALQRLVQLCAQLMNLLVYAPSLNDEDAFYFVNATRKALFKSLASRDLEAGIARVRVLFMFIQLYYLWGQRLLPPCLHGVDSNDRLYAGDDTYRMEVYNRFSLCVEEVVREIRALSESPDDASKQFAEAQTELMLDFINLVAPMLQYGEFQVGENIRHRKKSRSGVVLIHKCLNFCHEKLEHVKRRDVSASTKEMSRWTYFDNTRAFVIKLMQEMSKDMEGNKVDAQAVQELVEALGS
ncbi:uncharacterized protein CCR75_008039 [Bremia lactucae]|uniref:Uncharacterized protein n=1 Tax=Bremia lactucae TaxID=4779 RepID=A0A976NZI7_BRELC|nr:hypothetical protein CCR75_008039 [Bremia lactucae]